MAPRRPRAGAPIVYVMAVDNEYGPSLKARISPLMTGVGPVEAAIAITRFLMHAAATDTLPDLVVSLGSAGSARLQQCGVYQAHSVSYRDMDATAFGFPKGQTPFLDEPPVLELGPFIPGVPVASLSTGANVVSGADYASIDADMVDMETYAVQRACQQFGVRLIALRGISDGVSEVSTLADWTQYLHIIDERLAAIVDRLEDAYARDALLPAPDRL